MRKDLCCGINLAIAALLSSGCSSTTTRDDTEPSFLESIPFVYRPDIQQGNVLTQEKVNLLKPGMTRQQVRFILGTPLLVDTFHPNRWDYIYYLKKNNQPPEEKKLTLLFDKGHLNRIQGDLQPDPNAPVQNIDRETVVKVPDYVPEDRGIVERVLNGIGVQVLEEE